MAGAFYYACKGVKEGTVEAITARLDTSVHLRDNEVYF